MNFEDELHSCLFIFEITGLQYFSLKKLLSQKSNSTEKWRVVYMLVLLFCIFSLAVSYVIHDHRAVEGDVTPKNVLMLAFQKTMNIGIIMVEIISLLQSYWSTRKTMKIYESLKEIVHLCFNDFRTFIDFTKIKENARTRFRQMLTFIGVLHISLTIYHIKSTDAIFQLLLGIVPVFFLTMVVYKFIFYVDLVNSLLEFLKYLLEDIFNYQTIKIIATINSSTKTTKAPEDPMRKLRACWKIYMKIYEISGLVNDSIGLTMLALLSSLVVTLTISGYEVFVIVVGGLPVQKFPDTIYVIVYTHTVLATIMFRCQRTQKIMSTIATSVKKLECDNYDQLRYETREFMQNFYLQLVHQPVIFTAFGFYTLNLSLLASIVTGIVTYQIILVQFYAS